MRGLVLAPTRSRPSHAGHEGERPDALGETADRHLRTRFAVLMDNIGVDIEEIRVRLARQDNVRQRHGKARAR